MTPKVNQQQNIVWHQNGMCKLRTAGEQVNPISLFLFLTKNKNELKKLKRICAGYGENLKRNILLHLISFQSEHFESFQKENILQYFSLLMNLVNSLNYTIASARLVILKKFTNTI